MNVVLIDICYFECDCNNAFCMPLNTTLMLSVSKNKGISKACKNKFHLELIHFKRLIKIYVHIKSFVHQEDEIYCREINESDGENY